MKLQLKIQGLIFLFLLLQGTVLAQKDTLSFLHITDLHVIFNQDGYLPDMMEYRKQKQYDQGENRLRQFLETVPAKTRSDLVIATGDLVDFFEAEAMDSKMPDLQAEQFSHLLNDYHNHKNLVTGLPSGENNKIVQVQTCALVQNKENWRLIRLTEKNILVSVPGKTENELVIPVK